MEKLKTKPNDPESLSELYEAQKQISVWAESKNKPGQFTGSTGAKILSKGELTLGVQAWAKQSQFTDAPKVSGGFGEYILRKMGWKEGEGLGKDGSGEVDPLTLDIKQDMKGKYSPCYTKEQYLLNLILVDKDNKLFFILNVFRLKV